MVAELLKLLGELNNNARDDVKNANLNKGLTAQQWLSRENWNFILAIDYDVTDEDLFKTLPGNAWSIKVRPGVSAAKFSLDSPDEVRSLLRELMVK